MFLFPIANPDLFWHLKVGQGIALRGALPKDDFLSFTMMGSRWADFEWLPQLLFTGTYGAAGWAGLFLLKVLLLAMAGATVWALLRSSPWRRTLFLFWAALTVGRSELKVELFSIILFTMELWALEGFRLGALKVKPAYAAATALLFFVFWANLHPGFVGGLLLLAFYCLGQDRAGLRVLGAAFAAGAAGTLLNPYGWGLHGVLLQHARWMRVMSAYILEWKPLSFGNPFQWPEWVLLALTGAALLRRRPPWPHLAAALAFGASSALHARAAAYFVPLGLLVLAERVRDLPIRSWALGIPCAVYLSVTCFPALKDFRFFDSSLFPVAACDFIEREMETLRNRRIYNEWGWGGYLEFRFSPDIRVFMDGRYIFHPVLAGVAAANRDPREWNDFLDRHGVEWALMSNSPVPLTIQFRGADGQLMTRDIPHLAAYMPVSRWARVFSDPVANLYVRRGSVPREWLGRWEGCASRGP